MPVATAEPSTSLDRSALAGQSPIEAAASTANPPEGFADGLRAAQAKDKGPTTPPAAPVPAAAPATPAEPKTPRVPSLPTTPTATPTAVDDYEPKGETAKHWKAMKARHAEEVAAIKAELDRIKTDASKAVAAPEVEALKTELNRYRETLRDVAIERDPAFQQKFAPKEQAIIDQIKLSAGPNGEKLAALLKYPASPIRDEQIKALTDDLPETAQRRINAGLGVLDQIDLERQAEIASHRANFDAKQNAIMSQQQQQQTQTIAARKAAFDAVSKEWAEKNPFFMERAGDETHNAAVAESRALAQEILFGKMSPEELSTAAHWAAMGRRALDGWQTMRKERDDAIAALDKMRGAQPGDGRATQVSEGTENTPKPGDPSYLKYMQQRLREAQQKDLGR